MTPEEFQKIKEAEKEHLRALKKLKQAVRGLEQRNKVTKAVTDIASSTGSLLEEHENLVEKLAQETALQEARLELALESAAEKANLDPEATSGQSAEATDADSAAIDEELAKRRASDLVRQMKSQMGGELPSRQSSTEASPEQDVQKTIGRMGTSDTAPESTEPAESHVPEKTIGRMKRDQ